MKPMLIGSVRRRGFALPTILLVSIVMMTVLLASIGALGGSRVALDSQYYNELARQAAESGVARANECLKGSGYTPQWTSAAYGAALTPGSTCTGTGTSYAAYVVNSSNLRTYFSVDAPSGAGIGSELKVTGSAELLRTSLNSDGEQDVWKRYDSVTYLRIEPPQTIPCPDGFVPVPGNSLFGTSDFCVAKYESKNVNGTAVSQAAGTPFVNINQIDAAAAAAVACNGCHLITQAEWLTVAHNVLNVASNWSGGAVGSGYIYSGHNDNSPSSMLAASTDDTDGYYGTTNTGGNQRRTLMLSNGKVVWDMAGNAWEWTDGTMTGGQPGLSGFASREYNAIEGTGSMSPSPFPSFGTSGAGSWNSSNGIGMINSNSTDSTQRGIERGGQKTNGSFAGIFTVNLGDTPTTANSAISFRMAK